MTNIKSVLLIVFLWTQQMFCHGQSLPGVNPSVDITPPGEEQITDITTYSGSAPLSCRFKAGATNTNGWDAFYEWRFYLDKERTTPYLKRNEEDTSIEISKAGTHYIQLYAIFVHDKDTIMFTEDDIQPITITVYESKLEMPNAFSPNNDGINDIYKPKTGYQSIVKFHAIIFNRWGQKLYEWDNPAEGWDGKSHGKEIKQGVYFCLVKAKGADGREFNIKTDVNLLRGYTEPTNHE